MCATKSKQARNRLKEGNLGTAPDNAVWATSTTLLLPPKKKHGVIQNNSGNSTERSDPVLHSTLPTEYTLHTHTINCPNTNSTKKPTIH